MPYKDPKQATAIFLSIKRKKGEAAAKAWARKHRGELKRKRRRRTIRSRS